MVVPCNINRTFYTVRNFKSYFDDRTLLKGQGENVDLLDESNSESNRETMWFIFFI